MILRVATAHDAVTLATFNGGGPPSAWLDEVTEIVSRLVSWQHDHDHQALDRRVIVADIDGQIVAVGAHERIEHDTLGPLPAHRYVMVTAVHADHRRAGSSTPRTSPRSLSAGQRSPMIAVAGLCQSTESSSVARCA